MIDISTVIMAHPKREAFIPGLVDRLAHRRIPHYTNKVEVIWDQHNDRIETGLRCLEAYDPQKSHHLIIQDDAIPCADLIVGLKWALKYIPPDSPMCLYVGKIRPMNSVVIRYVRQTSDSTSWLVMNRINWGVGIVLPTNHIPGIIANYTGLYHNKYVGHENYDRRVSLYFEEVSHQKVWYPWPNLVDHRDTPSLIEGRSGKRHAYNFIGESMSALDANFEGGVIEIPVELRA